MKQLKFLFIAVIVMVTITAQSQVPGYLGKKFSATIGTEVAPIVGAIGGVKPVYAFQPKLTGSVKYVVGLDKEISLFGSYRSTTGEVGEAKGSTNMVPVYNDIWSVGFSLRSYRNGTTGEIAPLGNYRAYFLGYAKSTVLDGGYLLGGDNVELGDWRSLFIGYGIGKQLILKDQFVIDYGARFIYAATAWEFVNRNLGLDINSVQDEYTRFDEQAQRALFSNYLFTIYLNFGTIQ